MTTTPVDDPRPSAADAPVAAARSEADVLVRRVVLGVAGLYALLVGTLALLRYESFASDFDHGIFSQYVWLLALHEPFNTINLRTLLGDHVEPGIALLAPLGTIGGAPGRSSCRPSRSPRPRRSVDARPRARRLGWVAAVPAILWCASPVVLRPALHDFHPEALVPVLLVGGCVLLARERLVWFLVTAVVACAMKEDVGLTYAALEARARVVGPTAPRRGLAVGSVAWSAIAVFVVLPAFGNAAEDEFGPRFAGVRGDSFADALEFMVRTR